MNKIYSFIVLAIALLSFTQCAKELNSETASTKPEAKKVNIVFSSNSASKSLITEKGEKLVFTWKTGDKIFVYDGTQYCGELLLNPECNDKEDGEFKGEITEPSSDEIKFFYFGTPSSAPKSSDFSLDVSTQARTLEWIQSNLVASCSMPYTGEQKYEGQLSVAYAVAKITLGDGYESGDQIGIRTFKQKVNVSSKGEITYSDSQNIDIQTFKPTSATFFFAMPAGVAADKLTICNLTKDTYKYFDTTIENGTFYHATAEFAAQQYVVRYWADCGDGAGLARLKYYEYNETTKEVEIKQLDDIPGTGLSHDIVAEEPFWAGTGDIVKTFLGWSTVSDDTQPRYISSLREIDLLHSVSTTGKVETEGPDAGKVVINLYAIWKTIQHSGPWVDYEHYMFSLINHFKHLDGWAFNEYIIFKNQTDRGFEKFNVPIHNLQQDHWYKLTFGELMTRPTSESSKNWWNKDSCYSTTVSKTPNNDITIKSMLPMCTGGDLRAYVWVHSEGSFGSSPYVPVSSASIVFKAEAETMYWVWDLSKQLDKEYVITYRFDNEQITEVTIPSGPNVHFLETALYNFRFKQNSENPTASSPWYETYGYSTYKTYAEDNNMIEFHTFGREGYYYGKVNVPIIGLTLGNKYTLKFTYDVENQGADKETDDIFRSYLDDASNQYDFCYGISATENSENTSNFHGTATPFTEPEGYSANFTNSKFKGKQTFNVEQTFTASAETMYLVLSMSNFKERIRLKHDIYNVSLTEVQDPE